MGTIIGIYEKGDVERKPIALPDIKDAELIPIVDEQPSGNKLRDLFNDSAEIAFEAHIDPKTFWLLCTGKQISNNWLKTHGGVMSRRGYGRKRRKEKECRRC